MHIIDRTATDVVIGIPSKGRLKQHVEDFLQKHGFVVVPPIGRQLQTHLSGIPHYKVVFFHAKDIPILTEKNFIDVGFTGLDLISETGAKIRPVIRLNRGHVKMSILVPKDKPWDHPFHLMNRTIGSPFPEIAKNYFDQLKIPVTIHKIQGASEGLPYLGVVDAIVDVVESGKTAKENNLKIIASNLFDSECVCIVHKPELQSNHSLVNDFLGKLYVSNN